METWQQQVIEKLARLDQWAESIDARLAQINGTVGRHDKAIIQLRENETARTRSEAAARDARIQEAAKYDRWLTPALRYVLFALGLLLLEHGHEVVGLLGRPRP